MYGAYTNGSILSDLEWPIAVQNHPIFYILYTYFHIFVLGGDRDFRFGS